jgi:hypothetical protein
MFFFHFNVLFHIQSIHFYICSVILQPITTTAWVRAHLCKLQKGCTRLAAASGKVYQLLTQGRWFSPGSFTTKTGRHDIAELLLKVVLNTKIQIQFSNFART